MNLITKLKKTVLVLPLLAVVACGNNSTPSATIASDDSHSHAGHFHPLGNQPSSYTINIRNEAYKLLPFDDVRDMEDNKRGLIAVPSFTKIMADAGHVAWDMESYEWLLEEGAEFDSIHPSLQRQAILNMAYGLYEVIPGNIYQVRGFDLANISFIKGSTGWIIYDVGTTAETARAALNFINEQLGERPVSAVIISHPHGDHFGGIRGVVSEEDVISGRVPIYAPESFLEHAVSENVYAGNAMSRRFQYQYGSHLPRSPYGHVDQAIGKNTPNGNPGLIPPTRSITRTMDERVIDGVRMIFQLTPGTEAPEEMNTYFPDLKALWGAENMVATIHNIYTLRGAQVRDALAWSHYLNETLYAFGQDAEVLFASHSWPRFGNDRVIEHIKTQRDAYAHLNNEVLRHANQGITINEIHNVYKVPASLQNSWSARSYHGSERHNSRAIIQRYLGFWDANPTTLMPLSPADSAPLYVEMMGGAQKIINKSKELYKQGKYLEMTELLNKVVYAEPSNTAAKNLLADAFEQLGYQMESTSLRNSFLAGANELRSGMPKGPSINSASLDVVRSMPTQLWLEFLAIRLDGSKVADLSFTMNITTTDNGEYFVWELSNSTLTSLPGFHSKNPTHTFTATRAELNRVFMGEIAPRTLVDEGKGQLTGDIEILTKLFAAMDTFSPDFEILPGTKNR